MIRPRVVIAAIAMTLAACNALTGVDDLLIDSNDGAPHGATPDASVIHPKTDGGGPGKDPDSGGLGQVDAAIVDGCKASTCDAVPAGFQVVAYGAGGFVCPSGFGQSFDAVENPTLSPGACGCGCDLNSPPTCAVPQGTLSLLYGPSGSASCTAPGQSVSAGGCQTDGFVGPFTPFDRQYDAPQATLTGGACTPKVNKNDMKLKSTNVRVCQATVLAQCDGKTCLAPTDKCIATAGDEFCPPAWPSRHIVGTTATFACGAGCSCTVGGLCSKTGSLSYFGSSDCSGAAGLTYPVGPCTSTPGSSTAFASHRYDPDPPASAGCKSSGTPAATTALTKPTTICCR